MPIGDVAANNWAGGINNRARRDQVPDGFVRDMVNFHPIGTTLRLRPQSAVHEVCTNLRGAFDAPDGLLLVDGDELSLLDDTNARRVLRTVPAAGKVSAAELDGTVYLCIGSAMLTYNRGGVVGDWGVPRPSVTPSTGTPQFPNRRFVLSFVGPTGVESGTTAQQELLGEVYVPAPPPEHVARLYVSATDGDEYHLYYEGGEATVTVGATNEAAMTAVTRHLNAPPPCEAMCSHKGMLFMVSGNIVVHTLPMGPHHVDMQENFFMYPVPVTGIACGLAGVYLSSDHVYLLSYTRSEFQQSIDDEHPAYRGAMMTESSGNVVYMTDRGLHREEQTDRGPKTRPLSEANFAPVPHEAAVLGEVDFDGEKIVVSSVTDVAPNARGLAASDYFEAEVVRP